MSFQLEHNIQGQKILCLRPCNTLKITEGQTRSNLLLLNYSKFLNFKQTGFPKKDANFLKLKNIPNLLSNDKEGKIRLSNFYGETLYKCLQYEKLNNLLQGLEKRLTALGLPGNALHTVPSLPLAPLQGWQHK